MSLDRYDLAYARAAGSRSARRYAALGDDAAARRYVERANRTNDPDVRALLRAAALASIKSRNANGWPRPPRCEEVDACAL